MLPPGARNSIEKDNYSEEVVFQFPPDPCLGSNCKYYYHGKASGRGRDRNLSHQGFLPVRSFPVVPRAATCGGVAFAAPIAGRPPAGGRWGVAERGCVRRCRGGAAFAAPGAGAPLADGCMGPDSALVWDLKS